MNIASILNSNANVSVTIGLNDLNEFFLSVVNAANSAENKKEEKDVYLTIEETCNKLHIDKSTAWRWSKIGLLPKIKTGGKAFYRLSDIKKLLKEE